MLTANELRIGNYLMAAEEEFVNHPPFKIQHGDIAQVATGMITHKYKPVPITEEWLLKFGFENRFENKDSGYKELFLRVNQFTLLAGFECDKFCSFYLKGSVTHIKHVHQLQNLYFALTGEELTLKN